MTLFDNSRGREWAAFNISKVDDFVEKNESKIVKTRTFAQWVVAVTGIALMRKRFKR
jgi:hypothetical protein